MERAYLVLTRINTILKTRDLYPNFLLLLLNFFVVLIFLHEQLGVVRGHGDGVTMSSLSTLVATAVNDARRRPIVQTVQICVQAHVLFDALLLPAF